MPRPPIRAVVSIPATKGGRLFFMCETPIFMYSDGFVEPSFIDENGGQLLEAEDPFTRLLFNGTSLTQSDFLRSTMLSRLLHICSEKKQLAPSQQEHLEAECSLLLETLSDIVLSTNQNQNQLGLQNKNGIVRIEKALEKLAPFLQPGLADKCWEYLGLNWIA